MKTSRATPRADNGQPSASSTVRRLPKALVLGIVALFLPAIASVGLIVPANAAVAWVPPVALSSAATTPGNGVLTITPVVVNDVAYTLSPNITGGATFAGGATSAPVEIIGTNPVKVPYTCTAPGGYITLGFGFKGSPILSVDALCGATAPVPSWNQSATIVPGPDGSGNADVEFNNAGSNQTGVFYVTIGNGAPTSATSVTAGQTKSIPVHAEPGTVIRVYGTNDGTATPRELAKLPLPMAPAEPVAPVIPVTPVTPVAPVVVETPTKPVASQQPVVKQPVQKERPNLTFETAASEPVQQANPWGAIALFAVAAAIVAVLVRRWRMAS